MKQQIAEKASMACARAKVVHHLMKLEMQGQMCTKWVKSYLDRVRMHGGSQCFDFELPIGRIMAQRAKKMFQVW